MIPKIAASAAKAHNKAAGSGAAFRPEVFTFATMPVISYHGASGAPKRMRWPMGFSPRKYLSGKRAIHNRDFARIG